MRTKRNRIKNISNIIGAVLILLSMVAFAFETAFAQEGLTGNTDDGTSGGRPCTSGNCASANKNGAFWVEVPLNGETKTFQQVFGSEGMAAWDMNGGTVFSNCPTTAYVLVTRLSGGGIAGPVDINKVSTGTGNRSFGGVTGPTKIKDYDGGWIPSGATGHTNQESEDKFNEHADFYNNNFHQSFYGTNMGWFCADPFGSSTPPPDGDDDTNWYDKCTEGRDRHIGQTTTRIAVRNRTLDDPVKNYRTDWTPRNGGPRSSLPNDSGWTDGGGEFFTIAKPGDSIQFLHSYCAAARYVRKTSVQGSWIKADLSYDQKLDMPTNHFHIGATPEFYLFGDGIDWVNSEAESSPEYGPPFDSGLFPTDPPIRTSMYVGSYRDELGTLSPTDNNNSYDCNGVSMYAAYGVGYKTNASFQIPGYDSGWSCNAANKTQSNTVGKTVTQWHKFNSVKSWEQYSNTHHGRCGCDSDNSAAMDAHYYKPEYGRGGSEWGDRWEWQCKPSPDCVACCRCPGAYTDNEGIWHCPQWYDDQWSNTDLSYYRFYLSKSKDYGERTKTARVYVPYNFKTSVKSSLDAGDTIFQGGPISSDFDWEVLPRVNDKLAGFDFATVTPGNTRVQFIEFIYAPYTGSYTGNKMSTADPCGYYGGGAVSCKVIDEIGGNQNPAGLYAGKKSTAAYTRTVPDDSEYVGFKYCVAMGFYPSDSHDYMDGNELWQQYSGGYGGAMDAGQYWNISNASCRTIAKKPSVQVWNGSTYTEGKITTSISKKMVGVSLGTSYNGSDTSIFGSWTDYSIIAGGSVKGMASGAVLGYNNGTYNLSGGGRRTSEMNLKRMSPLTFANSDSDNKTVGKSNVNASASIDVNLNRLRSRYSDKAKSFSAKDIGSSDVQNGYSQVSIRTSETGMQYAFYSGGGDLYLSSLVNNIKSYANAPNQTTHKNGNGLYKTLGDGINDNTLVIYTTGKFIIDGNICLGDGCHGSGMQLINYQLAGNSKTNSAAKLPQVLIFAKDIEIDENVTRVDAWLVAPDGDINTCKGASIGSLAARDAYQRYGEGSCYKTLMVNGPVYAKSLTLNRTAGATHGVATATDGTNVLYRQYGAIGASSDGDLGAQTPAEIFNLRADVYLWAYTQAQRYSEAVVTYMRELAPRY